MKKTASFLLACAMVLTAFAGCSSGTTSSTAGTSSAAGEESATQSEAASDEGSGEKTTVQFWHSMSGTNGDLINQLVSDYNASQDAVEVVATYQGSYADAAAKAEQAIYAGNAPDILQVAQDNVGRLAANGQFVDLLPYMEQDGVDPDDFVEAFVKDAYYDDQLVVVPFGRSAQVLYVNKTVLDELGCDIPTTWDELKEVANKCVVKDGDEVTRYGLTIPFDQWYLFALVQQAGGSFFNEEETDLACIDDGTLKKSFEFLLDMQETGALYFNDPTNDQSTKMFTEGMSVMMFNSSGGITGNTATIGDKFEMVVAPPLKDEVQSMPTGGCGFGIMTASQNPDAAWDFVKWYIQDEKGGLAFVLGSGYLPFTKTMAESDTIQNLWAENPNFKTAYDALEFGDDNYRITNLTPVIAEFRTCMQAIMLDNGDIDSALNTFRDATKTVLAE